MANGHSKPPKRKVRIDADDYLIRTVTAEDASDRWAAWMADPEVANLLNAPVRTMTKDEITTYIKSFDQRSNLLWSIFDKRTGSHIGFFTVNADYDRSQGIVNLLIGEGEHRNRGVLSTIRAHFARYFFETLGLKTMMATALAHNQVIINTLIKGGWKVDKVLKHHVTAHADGSKLDLWLMSLSRDTWRARNRPPVANKQTDQL
jgi:RimJ/RimL family protein N-acetyltransferase